MDPHSPLACLATENTSACPQCDPAAVLLEREFSADERKALAARHMAMDDGSFPIPDLDALKRAIQAIGRAADPVAARAHIMKRAKALGATDLLPADWPGSTKEAYDYSVLTGMDDAMRGKKMCPNCQAALDTEAGNCTECGADLHKTSRILGGATNGTAAHSDQTTIREGVQILEAVAGSKGKEWRVLLIEAGTSKNRVHYAPSVLQAAAPLYEGVPAYADHDERDDTATYAGRSVKDKVGSFKGPLFESVTIGGKIAEGITARFRVHAGWLREALTEALAAGEPDFYGLSHNVVADWKPATIGGVAVKDVTKITEVRSVDVVDRPSAGGRLLSIVEAERLSAGAASVSSDGDIEMNEDQIKALLATAMQNQQVALLEALKTEMSGAVTTAVAAAVPAPDGTVTTALQEVETLKAQLAEERRVAAATAKINAAVTAAAGLSEAGKANVGKLLRESAERRAVDDAEITVAIEQAVAYEAALVESISGAGKPASGGEPVRYRIGDDKADKLSKSLEAWFGRKGNVDGVPAVRSLQESYCQWQGISSWDFDPDAFANEVGGVRFQGERSHKAIRESLTVSSWGQLFADVMHLMMVKEFRATPFGDWRKLVSDFDNPTDFRTRHWAMVGGYGDLSSVAEGNTYPTLTTPGDDEITYTVTKFGGLDDVTMETLLGDRVNKVRQLPQKMAHAAARTLYKDILDFVTTDNPTWDVDSTALYTSHNNSGTTALSLAGLDAVWSAMRSQTIYGNTAEIAGPATQPKYLIVPNELTSRAERIINPSEGGYQISPTTDGDTSIDRDRFRGQGMEVLTYDYLTDATDWWAVCDPTKYPTIVVGFLGGREEPELFVADQPSAGGANFTADKSQYKCRIVYGFDLLDYRGMYRNVVA